MLDALRGYVQLATGLGEVTVAKAREVAAGLLSQGIDLDKVPDVPGKDSAVDAAKVAAGQVQALTDNLLEQSTQNRELMVGLVRTEVDRTAGRLGFVREEELAAVRRHVSRLESQLAEVRAQVMGDAPAPTAAAPAPAKKKVPVKKKVAPKPAATPQASASDVGAPASCDRAADRRVRRMSDEYETDGPADLHDVALPADSDRRDPGDLGDLGDQGDDGDAERLEVDVVEVEVVSVEVVEVDAATAYAARDAALEQAAHHDESLDAALDEVDDGGTAVREAHLPTGPGELPLLIPGRERFASLDAVPVTGDARVDAATARLDELADLPTADHVPVYDDVHHRLQDALADTDPT